MLEDPELRAQVARIRDQAREMRIEVKRHSKEPDWNLVRLSIYGPMLELQDRLAEELGPARTGQRPDRSARSRPGPRSVCRAGPSVLRAAGVGPVMGTLAAVLLGGRDWLPAATIALTGIVLLLTIAYARTTTDRRTKWLAGLLKASRIRTAGALSGRAALELDAGQTGGEPVSARRRQQPQHGDPVTRHNVARRMAARTADGGRSRLAGATGTGLRRAAVSRSTPECRTSAVSRR